MDFGLQSPFAHHLDPGDFQEELSSAVVTHNDEKIPMPQFYHNQQIECVNELEWETKSVKNLNNTAPIQYIKMRSMAQSEQNSSQIDIFNPAPQDSEFGSLQKYPKKVLLKNASSQFGRQEEERVQRGSSIHHSQRRDNKKGKYYSEPQSQQNSVSKNIANKEEDQQQQEKEMERKHADLMKRLAAIQDFSVGSSEVEKEEETVQTKEAQMSSNIETTSISFADIVKAIERVKFVPPTVQSIQEEEEGGGSFQTGQEIQKRHQDWSPASQPGIVTVFSKPKRAKQKSEMTALDKLNFDGEEIKFD